ncbi:MAG: DNA primase [Angelakisella sp.]
MLPESFLNELKYRCDIEQTIGGYVSLRRRGRNLTGLCPFHSEKSPSFTVYPENQSFFCFGCGAGGDIITFIRKIENLDYMEAVRFLAQRIGLELPADSEDGTHALRLKIQEMNREAARFYHQMLMSDEGKAARSYLVNRGMTKAMVTKFGVGYAPDGWQGLSDHLRGMGYTNDEMAAAALVARGKNGGVYDSFRDRIIFPIIDLRGTVIGFGGRIMAGSGPKYLNSGDTLVFKKSRNLFALNLAKNSKRKQLLLAEGYMDVVSIYQAGLDNAVATLGTALTEEQARLIASYTGEVVLAYDSDGPGQAATKRAVDMLERAGLKIKILSMQGAKDPDEYIKKFGAERFELLIDGSRTALEFEIAKLQGQHDLTQAEGRISFLQEFVRLMANTPSPIQRDVYLSKVCRELEVDRQAVVTQLDYALKKKQRTQAKKEAHELRPFTESGPQAKGDFQRQKYPKEALAGERLIAYLIKNPDRLDWVQRQVADELFVSPVDLDIYRAVRSRILAGEQPDMMSLCAVLADDRISRLSQMLSVDGGQKVSHGEAEDYVRVLREMQQQKTPQQEAEMGDDELRQYIASLSSGKR